MVTASTKLTLPVAGVRCAARHSRFSAARRSSSAYKSAATKRASCSANGNQVTERSIDDTVELLDAVGEDSASPASAWQWISDDLQEPGVPKAVAVEFMAQVIFNFASCSAVCAATELSGGDSLLKVGQVVTFHFFLLYVLVGGTQNISGGHFNPMVSAVMTYMRVIPLARFVTYVPAQVLGAIVGSSLQYFALAPDLQNAAHAGAQMVPPDHTVLQAFVGETAASFILIAIVLFWALDPKGDPKRIPLIMGITVPLLIFTVGPVSSMCINPARAIGPAFASGAWANHWIWWTAPFLGGFLACVPYRYMLDAEAQETS